MMSPVWFQSWFQYGSSLGSSLSVLFSYVVPVVPVYVLCAHIERVKTSQGKYRKRVEPLEPLEPNRAGVTA